MMVILFLTLFALFWVIFLIVWVDAGNSHSNPQSPVVVGALITVFDFHCLIPLSVFLHQKNFEMGFLSKGGYLQLASRLLHRFIRVSRDVGNARLLIVGAPMSLKPFANLRQVAFHLRRNARASQCMRIERGGAPVARQIRISSAAPYFLISFRYSERCCKSQVGLCCP